MKSRSSSRRFRAKYIDHRANFANPMLGRYMIDQPTQGSTRMGCGKDGTEFPVDISMSPLA